MRYDSSRRTVVGMRAASPTSRAVRRRPRHRRRGLRLLLGVLGALALAVAACGEDAPAPADGGDAAQSGGSGGDAGDGGEPSIVVTVNLLGSIVDLALGDVADVEWLMPPASDPHNFEVSPREAERLFDADLVVANGYDVEESLAPVLASAREDGVPVVEIAPELDPLPYSEVATDEEEGEPDPHVWTDVDRMSRVPGMVAEALLDEVGGLDEDAVRAAAAEATAELEDLDTWVAEEIDSLPEDRRYIVTNHHSFGYFADRYGMEVLGVVVPTGAALASPSAADLADLNDALAETGVPAIFIDTSKPADLADALASERDEPVELVELWAESLGPEGSGAETYVEVVEYNVERIVESLQP